MTSVEAKLRRCVTRLAIGSPAMASLLMGAVPAALAQEQAPARAAAGQEAAAPADDEIIVRGLSQREQARAIGRYVDGLTVMTDKDPLALYEPEIYCPAVFGLSPARNEQIAVRMRLVAKEAGVRPGGPDCAASAMVFFVEDKAAFLKLFKKTWPVYFAGAIGGMPPSEPGPAIAWQLTRDFDPQHMQLADKDERPRTVQSPAGGSRMLSMITRAVAASVVVIERKALVGLSATQIADYALMRTLTDQGPAKMRETKQLSVLGVLDAPMGSETPASVTAWDFAYLKGRYSGDPRFYGTRQASAIRAAIKHDLAQGSGDAQP